MPQSALCMECGGGGAHRFPSELRDVDGGALRGGEVRLHVAAREVEDAIVAVGHVHVSSAEQHRDHAAEAGSGTELHDALPLKVPVGEPLRHVLGEDDVALPHCTARAATSVLVELLPDHDLSSRSLEFATVAEYAGVQLAGIGEIFEARQCVDWRRFQCLRCKKPRKEKVRRSQMLQHFFSGDKAGHLYSNISCLAC